MPASRRPLTLVLFLALILVVAGVLSPVAADALTARSTRPDPKVGALFRAGAARHYCTASVVHSRSRNLVITAAHCVIGNGSSMRFVPALHDGLRPYGTWTVAHAYLHPAWINRHDWQHDYAFLQLKPLAWHGSLRHIEDVAGANDLAAAPARGQRVIVTGYVAGSGDKPISCSARVYFQRAFPAFDCHGYRGGTSGSPWVTRGRLRGVIGGLHQGGCVEATSYSSAFDPDTVTLWRRASAGRHPDVAPKPVGDGC